MEPSLLPSTRDRDRRRRARYRVRALLAIVFAGAVVLAIVSLYVHHAGNAGAARASAGKQRHGRHHRHPAAERVHFVAHPQPVPILVYHHVLSDRDESPLMYVSPSEFASQLRWLRDHGYQPVTLGTVYDAWTGRGSLPPHPVVISFDDGYVEQYTKAAPLLAHFGWPADLDLIVERHSLLTHTMVAHMIAAGWELDSHTVHHLVLNHLTADQLRVEVADSRIMLERMFHVPVRFFCYPGGDYNARAIAAVKDAGYQAATGTRYAAAVPKDLYTLPRIYCYRGESLTVFGQRLRRTVAAARGG